MTILISCLIAAAFLPFLAKVPVAIAMNKDGGYDNQHPRSQQARLTGFGSRALAAHQNAFESLMIFAPAVLLAIATEHTGQIICALAAAHVCLRLAYHLCYLANVGTLRSVVWTLATAAPFAIMMLCIPS